MVMSKCRTIRSLFIEALYDELSSEQKKAFEAHLRSCPKCSKAYAGLASTLKAMSRRKRTGPKPDFWTGYWDRLSPQLKAPVQKPSPIKEWRQWIPELFPLPRWAYQTAAAVALLVIGIFIGRTALGPSHGEKIIPQLTERREVSPELASYQNRTSQYLEKSKILLLGIINFDAETEDPVALDFSRKQQVSQELVQEAGVLKKGLTRYGAEDRFIELVSDLEVILLQIANLEKEHDLSAIELVRSGVDRKGILLKITIEEMRRSVPPFNEKTNHIST
jgi:hypothetical protein